MDEVESKKVAELQQMTAEQLVAEWRKLEEGSLSMQHAVVRLFCYNTIK